MKLTDAVQALIDKASARADQVVRQSALNLHELMVTRMPVGVTGRLRANLQLSAGSINRTSTDRGSPIPRARAAVAQWQPGQTIYVTNSVPYAHTVEYGLYGKPPGSANGPKTVGGYSRQAQAGFVRVSAAEFDQVVLKTMKRIR